LSGQFNVRNCLGATAAATWMGIEREAILEALATFKSVKRRMEVRGVVRGVTVIDDFAHHPTAVRETLEAVRQRYPHQRLVAVFTRSWTARKKIFSRLQSRLRAGRVCYCGPDFRVFPARSR
jgi:UDP-N-acetylmuramate: L-alanyl-gamma-D-glutamyl-meso-diaminopimelate ligase